MANEVQQLAVGTNAVDDLKPFYLLNPPLLTNYRMTAIKQEWRSSVGRQLVGSRLRYKPWGKPSVVLTFDVLTRAEVAYLAALEGSVTIYVLNEDTNAWGTYNGTWLPPRLQDVEKLRPKRPGVTFRRNAAYEIIDLYPTS